MADKMFELMEKMYIEFKDFKGDITAKVVSLDTKIGSMDTKIGSMDTKIGSMDTKIGSMDTKIGSMDTMIESLNTNVGNIRKDVLRIENKLDTNSKALFDGYSQTYEKLTVLEKKVDDISSKVENKM